MEKTKKYRIRHLPHNVRDELDARILSGRHTEPELQRWLEGLGFDISKSSINRHAISTRGYKTRKPVLVECLPVCGLPLPRLLQEFGAVSFHIGQLEKYREEMSRELVRRSTNTPPQIGDEAESGKEAKP